MRHAAGLTTRRLGSRRRSGPSFYDLNNYASNQGDLVATKGEQRANHNGLVNSNFRQSWDVKQTLRLDTQRTFAGNRPFYLKGGRGRHPIDPREEQPTAALLLDGPGRRRHGG